LPFWLVPACLQIGPIAPKVVLSLKREHCFQKILFFHEKCRCLKNMKKCHRNTSQNEVKFSPFGSSGRPCFHPWAPESAQGPQRDPLDHFWRAFGTQIAPSGCRFDAFRGHFCVVFLLFPVVLCTATLWYAIVSVKSSQLNLNHANICQVKSVQVKSRHSSHL